MGKRMGIGLMKWEKKKKVEIELVSLYILL